MKMPLTAMEKTMTGAGLGKGVAGKFRAQAGAC